jgi:hypothetical protein
MLISCSEPSNTEVNKQRDEIASPHGSSPAGEHTLPHCRAKAVLCGTANLAANVSDGSWLCENSSARATHRNIFDELHLWSQIILHARGSMPCWRIVFSTFRECMSFYTGSVRLGPSAMSAQCLDYPPEADSRRTSWHVRKVPDSDIRPDYSITSSARCCRNQGTSRPSALAVLRLITSSNLVGC